MPDLGVCEGVALGVFVPWSALESAIIEKQTFFNNLYLAAPLLGGVKVWNSDPHFPCFSDLLFLFED